MHKNSLVVIGNVGVRSLDGQPAIPVFREGLASAIDEIMGKQVDLLQKAVPDLARIAFLTNPANLTGETAFQHAAAAGDQARISVLPIRVQNPDDLESAFETLSKEQVGAVIALQTSP